MEQKQVKSASAFETLASAVENMTGIEYQLYFKTDEFKALARACRRSCKNQGKSEWAFGIITSAERFEDRPVEHYTNYGRIVASELSSF